jgi:hypothetical protein
MSLHYRQATVTDLEYQVQCQIFEWATLHRNTWPELDLLVGSPSGVRMSIGLRMKCLRLGIVKKGHPDLHLPVARGGFNAFYLELKVNGKKPTPEQMDYMARLRHEGNYASYCDGFDEAVAAIVSYLQMIRF